MFQILLLEEVIFYPVCMTKVFALAGLYNMAEITLYYDASEVQFAVLLSEVYMLHNGIQLCIL